MLVANNEIKLKEIQVRVLEDDEVFGTINAISVTTNSGSTLSKHQIHMKQLYKVPFKEQ